ncbi:hypothetical protein HS7_14180 [Sulfolobales archaeon HS-7]|nr:hypothetical protein HS7_14180 [Sulfolobales archaeon HS-7]
MLTVNEVTLHVRIRKFVEGQSLTTTLDPKILLDGTLLNKSVQDI